MAVTARDSCQLCLGPVDKSINSGGKSVNNLWSYLYHRNVRESVQVGVGDSVPKLTFSLFVGRGVEGRSGGSKEGLVKICGGCWKELEKLDKLHQQLEAVKKAIEVQVGMIDGRRKNEDSCHLASCFPKLQMSMAGAVVGKKNIGQALQFLGNLCNGMECSSSSHPVREMVGTGAGKGTLPNSLKETGSCVEELRNPFSPQMQQVTMKVEVEDVEISSMAFQSHPLKTEQEDFDPDAVSAEPNESYLFLDPQQPTAVPHDKQKDPLAITTGDLASPKPRTSRPRNNRKVAAANSKKITKACPCPICGKVFTKMHLRRHIKGHSKVLQCEYCNKTFSHAPNLSRHRKTHSGEKPYSCNFCQVRFTRKESLQDHWKRFHSESGSSK